MSRCPGKQKFPSAPHQVSATPLVLPIRQIQPKSMSYARQSWMYHATYRSRPGKPNIVGLCWPADLTEIGNHLMSLSMRKSNIPPFLARAGGTSTPDRRVRGSEKGLLICSIRGPCLPSTSSHGGYVTSNIHLVIIGIIRAKQAPARGFGGRRRWPYKVGRQNFSVLSRDPC
jgi:hypothetical protein